MQQGDVTFPILTAYGDGGFRFGDIRVEGPILIIDGAVERLVLGPGGALGDALLDRLRRAQIVPEFLLFGSGEAGELPPSAFRNALTEAQIGFEPMTTPAACRAYAMLREEGRAFAAALIAV